MKVTVNGKVDELPDNSSIAELLAARNLPPEIVIISLNDEVIKRDRWGTLRLNPNDSLDIVRIIGGG